MDREQILNVVIKHIRRNVDGIDAVEIDPGRSMAQYGASSLDMVEVVSASMRELDVRIPRTRLSNLKNIGELVDLFHDVKNQ